MWDAERHGRVTILTYTRPAHWADDERARVIVLTGGLPQPVIAAINGQASVIIACVARLYLAAHSEAP